ncbi:MAG: alanine/glycine:cation symporter family protein [Mariprofundaceae bacterium]|nr:alanine/glycine:cation symporter family protein [Mariprofundaceae bacterium]
MPFIWRTVFFLMVFFYTTSAFSAESAIDAFFGEVNGGLASVLIFDVMPSYISDTSMPFIVAWLIVGAVYLTVRFGFINVRLMGHAFQVIRGKYQQPQDRGEVSPFQALTTALSATVGLGNIAGVAIAISIGGPGATFWMIVAGFFGMTAKFTEVTLAQMYREYRPDGRIMGGAMVYLSRGLAEKGWPKTGANLAVLFAILCVLASLGGGNAFQVSQALSAVSQHVSILESMPWLFGVLMAIAVGLVIIGGIRRIAHTAEAIVPAMVLLYLAACLWIIITHLPAIPAAIVMIVHEAFAPIAVAGGMVGVLVQGFKRAAFSSEAGIGSAAIAHSTAAVKYPVRQGLVALYEPFIDTIIICTMTALVIILTGVYNAPEYAGLVASNQGAALTSVAFGSVVSWFPILLSVSVVLFAYSTMISWSYYGERCWTYVFGESFSMLYRLIFLSFIIIGSVVSAGNILEFSDLLLLSMAFPNFIALYVLQDKVADALREYLHKLRNGEMDQEILKNK